MAVGGLCTVHRGHSRNGAPLSARPPRQAPLRPSPPLPPLPPSPPPLPPLPPRLASQASQRVAVAKFRSVQTGHKIGGGWAGACSTDRKGDAAAARPAPSRLQPAHAAACDGLLLRPQKRQVQGWLPPQAEQFVRSTLLTSVQVVHCQSHAPTGSAGQRGVWTGRGTSALKTVLQEPHRTLMMRSPPEQAVSSKDEHVGHRTCTRDICAPSSFTQRRAARWGLLTETDLQVRLCDFVEISQSVSRQSVVSYFTVPPPRRLPYGSAAPGLTQVSSRNTCSCTRSRAREGTSIIRK